MAALDRCHPRRLQDSLRTVGLFFSAHDSSSMAMPIRVKCTRLNPRRHGQKSNRWFEFKPVFARVQAGRAPRASLARPDSGCHRGNPRCLSRAKPDAEHRHLTASHPVLVVQAQSLVEVDDHGVGADVPHRNGLRQGDALERTCARQRHVGLPLSKSTIAQVERQVIE